MTSVLCTLILVIHTTTFLPSHMSSPKASAFLLPYSLVCFPWTGQYVRALQGWVWATFSPCRKPYTRRSIDRYHMPQNHQVDVLESWPLPTVSDHLTNCLFHISTWNHLKACQLQRVRRQSLVGICNTGILPGTSAQSRISFPLNM